MTAAMLLHTFYLMLGPSMKRLQLEIRWATSIH